MRGWMSGGGSISSPSGSVGTPAKIARRYAEITKDFLCERIGVVRAKFGQKIGVGMSPSMPDGAQGRRRKGTSRRSRLLGSPASAPFNSLMYIRS